MSTTGVPSAPDRIRSGVETPVEADPAAESEVESEESAARGTGNEEGEGEPSEQPDPESERRRRRRTTRLITVSTWVRNIGALIILFAAWQLWGTAIIQHHSQDDLAQQFAEKVHHAQPSFSLLPATANLPGPPEGDVTALLQIPAIGLSQFVVEGTATDDLAKGPGHYIGTAQPGQGGNVAIAGHRTTHGAPFYNIGALKPGDAIYLTDLRAKRLTYIVAFSPFTVDPSNVSVLNYFGDNRLTLTTCNPPYSAAQRLIVVAGFKSGPSSKGSLSRTAGVDSGQPYKVTISGEAGWQIGLLPVVCLELALLVALGLTNRRWAAILGRDSRWVILVPIWAALIMLLFMTLSNFLPAAV
jgi:LPXTG-site transpeptidase (sortase) family protein